MGDLRRVAALAAIIAFLGEAGFAANINVGSPSSGWDEEIDFVFQYSSMHNVLKVTKANFDSCQASSPPKSYDGGKTVILLDSTGKWYFICGTAGHCDQGMKLEVNVVAPASSSPSSPSPPKKAASPVMNPPTSRAPFPSSKEASPYVSPS